MDYSTKISERMWNQPDKGELEAERENTFIDELRGSEVAVPDGDGGRRCERGCRERKCCCEGAGQVLY